MGLSLLDPSAALIGRRPYWVLPAGTATLGSPTPASTLLADGVFRHVKGGETRGGRAIPMIHYTTSQRVLARTDAAAPLNPRLIAASLTPLSARFPSRPMFRVSAPLRYPDGYQRNVTEIAEHRTRSLGHGSAQAEVRGRSHKTSTPIFNHRYRVAPAQNEGLAGRIIDPPRPITGLK